MYTGAAIHISEFINVKSATKPSRMAGLKIHSYISSSIDPTRVSSIGAKENKVFSKFYFYTIYVCLAFTNCISSPGK